MNSGFQTVYRRLEFPLLFTARFRKLYLIQDPLPNTSAMTWNTRLMLREGAFTALAFTLALYLYFLTSFWGMQDQWNDGVLKSYMTSGAAQIEILMAGIFFGGSIGLINRLTERLGVRSRPFYQVVLVMTAMNLLSFALVTGLIVLIMLVFVMSWNEVIATFNAISLRNAVSIIIFQIFIVWAINFALEIQRVVGYENLTRIFTGRYRNPREEQRVFLFMDLKGSTEIAESIGHRKFSELLQKCFQELTQVALQFGAHIYQYVGDEVVISWPCRKADTDAMQSVQAFFSYEKRLRMRQADYQSRFGVVPEFRGGIDVGAVMATEVGDVKREIVFHGDVLNTASRLLDLCKLRDERLVASDAIGAAASADPTIHTNWIEDVSLRGKQNSVLAHSLMPAN